MRVYLAGPDVFLPAAQARAVLLKSICTRHGLQGVSPLDELHDEPESWATLPEARRIALRYEAHISGCAALIANLTPFRGPSADVGTVFEIGYMRALGRPIFGWSNSAAPFTERTCAFLGAAAVRGPDGAWQDDNGMLIEAFGLSDNLMIDAAIQASGGQLFTTTVDDASRWTDLAAFQRCVAATAQKLAN